MDPLLLLLLCFAALTLLSYGLTWCVLKLAQRKKLLDIPNARSNHKTPTPKGAGLATSALLCVVTLLLAFSMDDKKLLLLPAGLLMLTLISWWDDRHDLPSYLRLCFHAIAAAAALYLTPLDLHWLWLPVLWVGLIWGINLYNFMDGIDGITASESIFLSLAIAFFAAQIPEMELTTIIALSITPIMLGFMAWNWHPARIFMGDSGSVPLGFLLGYLLLQCVSHGHLALALILPAYYLYDATATLLKRLHAGKNIFQAHSEHYYQQAVRAGKPHNQVVERLAVINGIILCFAGGYWYFPALAVLWVVLAYVAVHMLTHYALLKR